MHNGELAEKYQV